MRIIPKRNVFIPLAYSSLNLNLNLNLILNLILTLNLFLLLPTFTPMDHPVILFDGVCNFCNNMVNHLIRQDKNDRFRFAALQSETGQKLLLQNGLPTSDLESVVYIEKGRAYTSSTASLKIYNRLPWYWKWTQVFWILPRPIRDFFYDQLAKRRYRLFGKREECRIPTPEIRKKFLD